MHEGEPCEPFVLVHNHVAVLEDEEKLDQSEERVDSIVSQLHITHTVATDQLALNVSHVEPLVVFDNVDINSSAYVVYKIRDS